jgi:pyruvate formate lyase activating enzyme
MPNDSGIIFDIKKFALHDGPGIRTTVFLKGCPLNCWWCHNPEGINSEPEEMTKSSYDPSSTSPESKEIIGKLMTVEEVMTEIKKDWIFYEESGEGGVTFSGGEPLMRPLFLENLLDACKEEELMTTLDTCGFASWEILDRIKDKINLFLYDIKIIDEDKHRKYTGVSNSVILNNLQRLDAEGKKLIIRFPVIPGITDTNENVNQILDFIKSLKKTNEIHLLPFHNIAKGKYIKLNRNNPLENTDPPTKEKISKIKSLFEEVGFIVGIGG